LNTAGKKRTGTVCLTYHYSCFWKKMVNKSTDDQPNTYFAPARRVEEEARLRDCARTVAQDPLLQTIERVIDGYMLVLNEERQVIAANERFLCDMGIGAIDCILGRRPGEILDCIHVPDGPGGCGTSKACPSCGAVLSILESRKQQASVIAECLLSRLVNGFQESSEFRVRTSPVKIGDQSYTVMVLNDIGGEKRRAALERVFFHDILNTIGGLKNWSSLLRNTEKMDPRKAAEWIVTLSDRLAREVEDQQRLLRAERGELVVVPENIEISKVFDTILSIFIAHPAAKDKKLEIENVDPGKCVITDPSLLVRVLTNMIKNAFEAVECGETVRVWFELREDRPVFLVWNRGTIPEKVALQIFQRSFSTKGQSGRGLGTYSMKLFGERYLGGEVSFCSTEETGTIFSIALPPGGPPVK
jgi:hypothetical protein